MFQHVDFNLVEQSKQGHKSFGTLRGFKVLNRRPNLGHQIAAPLKCGNITIRYHYQTTIRSIKNIIQMDIKDLGYMIIADY